MQRNDSDRAPTEPERIPTVAIVGRPNVGKSTVFNRLIRKRKAITLNEPGITRDPISHEVEWDDRKIVLVDTGGLGGEQQIALAEAVHNHTLRSLEDADLIVALFDARAGLSPLDRDTIELLTRTKRPVLYAANKADGRRDEENALEFCALGIDPPLTLSAEHGSGLSTLKTAILEALEAAAAWETNESRKQAEAIRTDDTDELTPTDKRVPAIAIIGRPNVGKSSLLNLVAGSELSLVHDQPGTTRDVVDTSVEVNGQRYLLLDTAGIRRPARIDEEIEGLSVGRSIDALRRAHVALLLIEPTELMTDQDARIAQLALREGRALVIVVNKMDLADGARPNDLTDEIFRRYPTLRFALTGFMSVSEQEGISECFQLIDQASVAHSLEVQTAMLNQILATCIERRDPPVISGGRLKLFYAAQTATRPPTFGVFVNRVHIPEAYQRFVERMFREALPLAGTPVRIRYKRRDSHGPDRA